MLVATLALLAPPSVTMSVQNGKALLTRGGKPYRIHGAGVGNSTEESFARLAAAGGNSGRTWGVGDDTRGLLDLAQKHGMTLQVGFWLGHVRHGFDWKDPATLQKQRDEVRRRVRELRDHPAVLAWALGNEMEIDNDNPVLWNEIEVLAKIVKEEDPTRPVCTVVAEISREKAEYLKTLCPTLDYVGINSYGGMDTLNRRLKEFGWTKPFVVTEFGPLGPWEMPKTPWGAAIEPTSAEKAARYEKSFREVIEGNPLCLGGYAFLWGWKQEETSSWFGMMLPTGENTPAVDVATRYWSGKWPKNRCPDLRSLTLEGPNEVAPGTPLRLKAVAKDPDGDRLAYEWRFVAESDDKRVGGDAERVPETLSAHEGGPVETLNAPKNRGAYRVFLTVRDGKNNAAIANVPVRVR